MKCPFCAEEIQEAAVRCRFCGAVKAGERWQMAPPRAVRPPGTFTMRFAGAAFGVSAMLELAGIGSAVPMFGALRSGALAIAYHGAYVVLFAGLCFGLWDARSWGYRLLLAGTWLYTVDNLRYVLDRAGMKAQIDRQIGSLSGFTNVIDSDSLMRMATLVAVLCVACWWGFALYARRRRSYFAA